MSGSSGPSGRAPTGAPRSRREDSAAEKSALRLAAALEDAGQLQEAARIHEQIGEHAQAAMLRLEHARTLRDEEQRLTVLREGAARIAGDTPQGQALHRSLARELLSFAQGLPDGVRRRGILQEAAHALVHADQGEAAGDIFERLGLLGRAIEAYERGGAISKLEVLLEVRDRRERASADLAAARSHVEAALREGARSSAMEWLGELARPRLSGEPDLELMAAARRRAELETLRPSTEQLSLHWRDEAQGFAGTLTVAQRDSFVIGRSPQAHLPVYGPELSREHVAIHLRRVALDAPADGRERARQEPADLAPAQRGVVELVDLGSRAGTFLEGDALTPHEPLEVTDRATIEVGRSASIEITPIPDAMRDDTSGEDLSSQTVARSRPAVLIAESSRAAALHFHYVTPDAGPLWLTPDLRAPARIGFSGPWVVLDADPGVSVELNREVLSPGARIELLRGDKVRLGDAPGLVLEVHA